MKQLMIKAIMIAVGVPLVIGVTSQAEQKTLDTYNIVEADTALFKSCKSGLSVYDVEFKGGASANKGCACVTKYAASEYDSKNFIAYKKLLSSKFKAGRAALDAKSTEDQLKVMTDNLDALSKIEEITGVSSSKLLAISEKISETVKFCGKSNAHNKANIQIIASLPRKGENVVQASTSQPTRVATLPQLRK